MKEIERKWLVKELIDLQAYEADTIEQGYIIVAENGDELRLRNKNGVYIQTLKKGAGLVREEVEITLTIEQFEKLWPLTEGRRLKKKRYKIPCAEYLIELDVFDDISLVLVEVEFDSEEQAVSFTPPEWFGEDVTAASEYKNRNIALGSLRGVL